MRLRNWFTRPKPAAAGASAAPKIEVPITAAELATKVAAAKTDLAAAEQHLVAARDRFAAERTAEAGNAVTLAKTDVEDVAEQLRIIEQEHAATLERERQDARFALEERALKLASQLSAKSITEAATPLAVREAAARLELAKIIEERLTLADQFMALHQESLQVAASLGASMPSTIESVSTSTRLIVGGRSLVVEQLEGMTARLPRGRLRDVASSLTPEDNRNYPGVIPGHLRSLVGRALSNV